jgi:hypothetical protein
MTAPPDDKGSGTSDADCVERGCHFTYCEPASSDLRQGDILSRNAALSAVLRDVHPHYHRKDDYTHFMVLTQACDLVRRGGQACKAKYVSLAAIRPLQVVLEREVARHQKHEIEKIGQVWSMDHRGRVHEFLRRVLNNNEPEYFYLEPEPAFELGADVFKSLCIKQL